MELALDLLEGEGETTNTSSFLFLTIASYKGKGM